MKNKIKVLILSVIVIGFIYNVIIYKKYKSDSFVKSCDNLKFYLKQYYLSNRFTPKYDEFINYVNATSGGDPLLDDFLLDENIEILSDENNFTFLLKRYGTKETRLVDYSLIEHIMGNNIVLSKGEIPSICNLENKRFFSSFEIDNTQEIEIQKSIRQYINGFKIVKDTFKFDSKKYLYLKASNKDSFSLEVFCNEIVVPEFVKDSIKAILTNKVDFKVNCEMYIPYFYFDENPPVWEKKLNNQ